MGTCQTWETTTTSPTLITFDLGPPRWHLLCSIGLQKPPDPCHPRTVALFGKTKFQWAEFSAMVHRLMARASQLCAVRKWRAPVAQRRTGPSRESWRLLLDDKSRSGDSRALSPAPKKRHVTWEQWVEPMGTSTLSTGLQCLFSLPFVL